MLGELTVQTGVPVGLCTPICFGASSHHRMRHFPSPSPPASPPRLNNPPPPATAICTCLLHSAITFPLVDLRVYVVGIFRSSDDAYGRGHTTPLAPRLGKAQLPICRLSGPCATVCQEPSGRRQRTLSKATPLQIRHEGPVCQLSSPRPSGQSRMSAVGKGREGARGSPSGRECKVLAAGKHCVLVF